LLLVGGPAIELLLFARSLESSLSYFGCGINEFEFDVLGVFLERLGDQSLAERDVAVDRTLDGALDHHIVLSEETLALKAAHGVDALFGEVEVGHAVLALGVLQVLADALDAFVALGAVVETHLSGAGDGPQDSAGVPRSDAADLAETSVGLAGQLLAPPSCDDAVESVTLGDRNGVAEFVVLKHRIYGDVLLQQRASEVDLLADVAAVDLDFHDVGLLLCSDPLLGALVVELLEVSVCDHADDGGFLLELV